MVSSIIPNYSAIVGGSAAGGGGGSRTVSDQVVDATPQAVATQVAQQPVRVSIPNDQVTQDLQTRRTDALRQAISESLPRFFMPVSDVRFTIFKDSGGQFITRFTNIVSGEVSQVPEPQLMDMISNSGIGGTSGFVQTVA